MEKFDVSFDSHVNGFARVEYLSVFVALLYAFAVAEYFVGWAKMLRNREEITFCPDHLSFTLIAFWILIINWYTLWSQIKYIDQGFFYFILTLVRIILTYLSSVFLFPDLDKHKDLKIYFDKNFKIITVLSIGFMVSTMAIQVWEEHLTISNPFVLFRLTNCVLMSIVAYFD